jgi:xanthosine utilization system XapX-like protein
VTQFRITIFFLAALGMGIALWFVWATVRVVAYLPPFIALGAGIPLIPVFSIHCLSAKGDVSKF